MRDPRTRQSPDGGAERFAGPLTALRAAAPDPVLTPAGPPARDTLVTSLLRSVRTALGFDAAYVAEFAGEERLLRFVDTEGTAGTRGQVDFRDPAGSRSPTGSAGDDDRPALVHEGQVNRLEDTLCLRIVDGRLPYAVRDVTAHPATADLPLVREGAVRAHLGVPIRLGDGSLFGTVCAVSAAARDVDDRDVAVLRVAADVVANLVEEERSEELRRARTLRALETVLRGDGHRLVYQPILELESRRPVGYEALSRFAGPLGPGADAWFGAAVDVGLDVELEIAALATALRDLADLPRDTYLSVNVSPATVGDHRLRELLAEAPRNRLVLELTEHARVDDYPRLAAQVAELARDGLRIAVDDAGAGYASLRHVLWLSPDIVKLDVSVCLGVHRDPARQAMAWALGWFSRRIRVTLVAEGIEDPRDLAELQSIGVRYGQGFLLGRPAPLRQPQVTALPA